MTLIRPIRLALLLASFSSMPALAAPAPESSLAKMATEAMNQLYKRYDDAKKCWVTRYQGDIYCMEIDSVNQAGGMLHVFAIGSTSDAAHVTPGVAGGIVLDITSRPAKVVAASKVIGGYGNTGMPPDAWQFTRLGSKAWGWINTSSDIHQGVIEGSMSILGVHGKEIVELGGFASLFSCEDCAGVKGTADDINSAIQFDTLNDKPMYPFTVRMFGKRNGKPLDITYKNISFDPGTGRYRMPKMLLDR